MPKDSSARYYKKNKEKIQKMSRKRYQNLTIKILLKKKKTENKNMVLNDKV